jgi:hypothetical protein
LFLNRQNSRSFQALFLSFRFIARRQEVVQHFSFRYPVCRYSHVSLLHDYQAYSATLKLVNMFMTLFQIHFSPTSLQLIHILRFPLTLKYPLGCCNVNPVSRHFILRSVLPSSGENYDSYLPSSIIVALCLLLFSIVKIGAVLMNYRYLGYPLGSF